MLANLKAALAARRLRQADLAFALKLAPSTLSEIIHGRRRVEPHIAARIAEILEADPEWLFTEIRHIPAPKAAANFEAAPALACAPGGER